MRKQLIIIVSALWGVIGTLSAQKEIYTRHQYEMNIAKSMWLQSNNSAGLGLEHLPKVNVVSFGYDYTSGKFKLAEEAERENRLAFEAVTFQPLGKHLRLYGRFAVDYMHQNNRAWFDGILPTENPYTWGSDRKGNYNRYFYDLNVKVSTLRLGRFSYGLGLNYRVGDLSRLSDPRPRVMYAMYELAPSITFQVDKYRTLGANLFYKYQKERLNNITAVRKDVNYNYFLFKGLDNYYSTHALGNISRRNVANIFGGDLQYSYRKGAWNWLSNLGYAMHNEDIIENEQASPGAYNRFEIKAGTQIQYQKNDFLHALTVNVMYQKGQANTYIQEQKNISMDNGNIYTIWVTKYDNITYNHDGYSVDFNYNLFMGKVKRNDYKRKIGVNAQIYEWEHRYILPESKQTLQNAVLGIDYQERVLRTQNGNELWFEGSIAGVKNFKGDLSLDLKNVYTEKVLVPNASYLKDNFLTYRLGVAYNMPIQSKKTKLNLQLKAFYQNITQNARGNRMHTGFSLSLVNL